MLTRIPATIMATSLFRITRPFKPIADRDTDPFADRGSVLSRCGFRCGQSRRRAMQVEAAKRDDWRPGRHSASLPRDRRSR